MARTKAAAASKASKKTSKTSAPTAKADTKVKKTRTSRNAASGVRREPTPYIVFFKANYARVKAENPDLLPKEMMAKIAEVWLQEPSNPKSPNYAGPALPKTAKK